MIDGRAGLLLLAASVVTACAGTSLEWPWHRPASRGMWVWSTGPLLASPSERDALFAFSRAHGIGELWVQVTTGRVETSGEFRLEVTQRDAWRALIAAAHARGLRVEALDGDPTYADAAFHYVPLAIADAVIAFNRDSPSRARFDGLHFDNEPYRLPGWNDPQSRAQLVRDHLTLNGELQRRVQQARPLTFGIDLPFWWDPDASSQLLARLDAVTIMDYRNEASGNDGIIALATPLLNAAARADHATVRVGVETGQFEETRVWFAVGPSVATARDTLGRSWRLRYPGDPFRLRSVEDNGRVHLGVTCCYSGAAGPPPPELVAIARDYGRPAGAANPVPTLAGRAEWRNVERQVIADSEGNVQYDGFIATNVPQPKLTFATRPEALAEETAIADRAFRQFVRYRGLAIHDYHGFQALSRKADTR